MNESIINVVINLIEGYSIGLFASIPLGPIGVLCIQRTINKGRTSGFFSGLGAATSDLVYAIVACFSVGIVTTFIEEQRTLLLIFGGLFLIGLGLKMFFSNPEKKLKIKQQKRSTNIWQDYLTTFFLTITNPLALVVFLTAFSIAGSERSFAEHLIMLGGIFLGASSWWAILTFLVGHFRKKFTLKRLYYFNKTAGVVIIVLVVAIFFKEFIGYLID